MLFPWLTLVSPLLSLFLHAACASHVVALHGLVNAVLNSNAGKPCSSAGLQLRTLRR